MEDEIPDPEWAPQRVLWYSKIFVLLEMAKILKHRELVFLEKPNPKQQIHGRKLKTIRCAAGYTVDLLKSNFNAFSIKENPYVNLYYSLMHINKMPLFSYSAKVRTQKYMEWTYGGYQSQYSGYDLALDFDGENGIDQAQKDCWHAHKIFEEFQVPHTIRFSGSRGFHLCVDYKWLPQIPEAKIVPFCAEFGTMLGQIEGLATLDDTIFDSRRVFKLPYSFCQGNIVLPLTDDQLEHFDMSMVNPDCVLKHCQIKNRGLLERYSDLSEEVGRANLIRMAAQFIDTKAYIGDPNKNMLN